MRSCKDCKHADWQRTANGRLHRGGFGQCTYEYVMPALPQSKWWLGGKCPIPYGGPIERKKELKDHCVYWARVA